MTDNLTLIIAFGAGLASFLSPCVLPLVPVYLAGINSPGTVQGGSSVHRMPILVNSIAFVLGFTVVFVALGALAGLTGFATRLSSVVLDRIAGSLLIVFGLFMLTALKVPWLNFERRLGGLAGRTTGRLRSFLIGATFSLGWTACIGPILGSILVLASSRATAWQGAYLLSVYSLGLGLPFLAMGLAFDWLAPLASRVRRFSTVIAVGSGVLLIGVGVLMVSNNLLRIISAVPWF